MANRFEFFKSPHFSGSVEVAIVAAIAALPFAYRALTARKPNQSHVDKIARPSEDHTSHLSR
jgi:hypothetical protein